MKNADETKVIEINWSSSDELNQAHLTPDGDSCKWGLNNLGTGKLENVVKCADTFGNPQSITTTETLIHSSKKFPADTRKLTIVSSGLTAAGSVEHPEVTLSTVTDGHVTATLGDANYAGMCSLVIKSTDIDPEGVREWSMYLESPDNDISMRPVAKTSGPATLKKGESVHFYAYVTAPDGSTTQGKFDKEGFSITGCHNGLNNTQTTYQGFTAVLISGTVDGAGGGFFGINYRATDADGNQACVQWAWKIEGEGGSVKSPIVEKLEEAVEPKPKRKTRKQTQ
ncbi:TPA: hypothetical protein OMT00_001652 [Klebsiella aerogenes]|uniref:hypothetical protein n=1 Tax=Klebsiella aerogenes TaxID=548 RepID=UPI0017859C98|nr:hypothetical protein [Klebsiella aerogenes]MBE0184150.1 hypothetical protein [Klebsiella aerogenes]MBE0245987.1 hypothetical protein [Klebsiella aerogenes]HCR0680449.1 hypothetical protein [Klebsiella aerogenes]